MINLHTHTTYSDGQNTIEETVRAAIEKGFAGIGISDHAYTHLYADGSLKENLFDEYLAEIRAIAARYPSIRVYAGLENEYCCPQPVYGLDYVIGSVHYLSHGDGMYNVVDASPAEFVQMMSDIPDFIRRYYQAVADMALTQKPDIIGHFDLITKFNRGGAYFNTRSDEYMSIVKSSLEAISRTDCVIEVNTGGMARGYTDEPYPEWHILEEIQKMGIPVIISSDSHSNAGLDYAFKETESRLREMGLTCLKSIPDSY